MVTMAANDCAKLASPMKPAVRTVFSVAYTLRMSEKALLRTLVHRSDDAVKQTAIEWAKTLCDRCGVHVKARDADLIDWKQPFVVASNHQSLFDIPSIIVALDTAFGFLTKKELFSLPLFGRAMRGLGCVSIDRTDPQSARNSIAQAAAQVREGASIVVFPEGTRSPDGRLLPFKKGPFYLVQAAGVPMVPVGVIGTHRILSKNGVLVYPGEVEVRVGRPISCRGDSRQAREELRQNLREAILNLTGLDDG
jgi:1-acyl-sn-glycerol-3-phosphate acyltransferase